MFIFTQFLQVSLTAGLLIRFYRIDQVGLSQSAIVTAVTVALIALTLKAQWTTNKTNPGFIIVDTESVKNAELVCKRCEAQRPDLKTHHCSSCKRCVLEMQHHCIFTDACVGKHNLKHFLRYCFWMTIFLMWALAIITKGFYWQNQALGMGVTGLTKLNPLFVLYEFVQLTNIAHHVQKGMTVYNQGGNQMFADMLISADNVLFFVALGFGIFVVYLLTRTLNNLMNNTSQPDKLKNVTHGPPRSLAQVLADTFGKQASFLSMLNSFN
jgi:hypothetical protein